ncbi:hypothetical protein AYO49_03955 [Verrucomicrobiaceae bacterium SCGC AG-212-N21]|nr:hypothetical protein AYO49_03955 [Verrucomicrobiaceae bacterium SCGC AG-212-N21]
MLADEPPLPSLNQPMQPLPAPAPASEAPDVPTMVIKPPASGPIVVPPRMIEPRMIAPRMVEVTNEETILQLERRLIEEQVRRRIAVAYASGKASALKKLIVMSGPVDASVSRAAKPPKVAGGQVALVGLDKGTVVTKNLEQFFGAPMTPDREQELIDSVKSQLADKDMSKVDVHIAGWWPVEGVMAVSVVPKGSAGG